ncbi:hypothetical protein [Salinactinospora qingdaonensis]|uniref:hypothetical protein n=1 Tax=Salinactinospora qingdaonensis TaxID=702744 RepID=UPI0031ED0C95
MSQVLENLRWDGITPRVSMFVVTESARAPKLEFDIKGTKPKKTKVFHLEDEDETLQGVNIFEYDLTFDTLPTDPLQYLKSCLRQACIKGGNLAWLGFEGSFHYDHLLTDEIAEEIYGICGENEEPIVILDEEELHKASWKETLQIYRSKHNLSQRGKT